MSGKTSKQGAVPVCGRQARQNLAAEVHFVIQGYYIIFNSLIKGGKIRTVAKLTAVRILPP